VVKNIEKGEGKLRRVDEMADALNAKVARYKNPWTELKLVYGQNKGKAYIDDEDRFLVRGIENNY
jgi:SWI/SNF-related matrix-associated actin-dependent regulator of chromatin subfamily A member 5